MLPIYIYIYISSQSYEYVTNLISICRFSFLVGLNHPVEKKHRWSDWISYPRTWTYGPPSRPLCAWRRKPTASMGHRMLKLPPSWQMVSGWTWYLGSCGWETPGHYPSLSYRSCHCYGGDWHPGKPGQPKRYRMKRKLLALNIFGWEILIEIHAWKTQGGERNRWSLCMIIWKTEHHLEGMPKFPSPSIHSQLRQL